MRLAIAFAALLFATGCADLMPTTMRVVPQAPIVAAPNEAVVVVLRPSPTGSAGRPDDLPLGERWRVLRVIDERRTFLADLRYNQHAALHMAPGPHELFAYAWYDDGRHAECTGALRGTLAAGRVYAVLARDLERVGSRKHGCNHVELVRALADERAWFWRFARERSERVEVLPDRERSIFLDSPWMSQVHVEVGRLRFRGEEAPVHGDATVGPDDGEASL